MASMAALTTWKACMHVRAMEMGAHVRRQQRADQAKRAPGDGLGGRRAENRLPASRQLPLLVVVHRLDKTVLGTIAHRVHEAGKFIIEQVMQGDVQGLPIRAEASAEAVEIIFYNYAYQYDGVANVKQVTETYSGTSLNRVVANSYDGANRLMSEAVTGDASGTTTYLYDDANNRTSMTKAGIVTSSTYNSLNQLTTFVEGGTRTVTYGFVDGPNLYTYVKQNPWTSFDPEGLAVLTDDPNKKEQPESPSGDTWAPVSFGIQTPTYTAPEGSASEAEMLNTPQYQEGAVPWFFLPRNSLSDLLSFSGPDQTFVFFLQVNEIGSHCR